MFANPRSPGTLSGCVEDAGGGRVIVHNSSEQAWHRCNIVKPDRSHFVLEKLTAGDRESIRSGVFMAGPPLRPTTALSLRCVEGELTAAASR